VAEAGALMRVVVIHRYFWPDTPPYAHILKEIALALGEEGHDVTVLTCQPSYNRAAVAGAPRSERLSKRVAVRRWPVLPDRRSSVVKAANLAWFCLRLALSRRRLGSVDVVMAASSPPIAVARVGLWLARRTGARFLYHKQDIYPDVVTAPGILPDGRRAAALRWLDSRSERSADRVIVLSEDMAATVRTRGVDPQRIAVINNFDPWPLAEPAEAAEQRQTDGQDGFHLAFAGNLGRFQNLEMVIAIAGILRSHPGVVFHFIGDGALRPWLARKAEENQLVNVRFHGYLPPADVADFLRARADIGIVSLLPGVIRAAYPSKTMSYLRQGCPVLALVEADSALARSIESAGAGFAADPGDPAAAAELILRLAEDPAQLARAGARARRLYESQFAQTRQLAKWRDLLQDVSKDGFDRGGR
jgi:glycosyltransferase involved in cell wall biosynthesis